MVPRKCAAADFSCDGGHELFMDGLIGHDIGWVFSRPEFMKANQKESCGMSMMPTSTKHVEAFMDVGARIVIAMGRHYRADCDGAARP